jgi:CshA-type fibril repeat protein
MGRVRSCTLGLALACLTTIALDSSSALAESAPVALASTGVGTAVQQVAVPEGSALVGPGGDHTDGLEVDGVGSFQLSGGSLVFHPALGFTGSHGVLVATPDGTGQGDEGTYTPSVTLPSPPIAPALSSTGSYGQPARCLVAVPEHGRAVLLDATGRPTLDAVDAAGEFTADPSTGVVAFVPAGGFSGPATIGYRVTDAYGQSAAGGCTILVEAPPAALDEQLVAPATSAPVAVRARTRGGAHRQQVVRLAVPPGGNASLVNAGVATLHVYRPGQGSYALDPGSETITFTPSAGFHGVGSVTYRLTDAYGRSAENAYTPTVLAAHKRPRAPVHHPGAHTPALRRPL